jgi:hypothetical protein
VDPSAFSRGQRVRVHLKPGTGTVRVFFGGTEAASYDLLNGSGTHQTIVVNNELRAFVEVEVPNLPAGAKACGVQVMHRGLTSAPVACALN